MTLGEISAKAGKGLVVETASGILESTWETHVSKTPRDGGAPGAARLLRFGVP